MSASGRPKKPGPSPDGKPRPAAPDKDSMSKSRMSEVQDPLISGDAGKDVVETGDVVVDKAGQVRRKDQDVDLLH